jgi:hypothetical protein
MSQKKVVGETKTDVLFSVTFFTKIVLFVRDNVEKYSTAIQMTHDCIQLGGKVELCMLG